MAKFNQVERIFARVLSRLPYLKARIKKIYLYVNFFIYRDNVAAKSLFPIFEYGIDGYNTFFGYYDKSPENITGEFVLVHGVSEANDQNEGAVFVLDNDGVVLKEYTTRAMNLQQGSKSQWVSTNRFIFNDIDEATGALVSRLCDAKSGEIIRSYSMPVYDCYKEDFSLTINFDRLTKFSPEYGYCCRFVSELPSAEEDGIYKIDFSSGRVDLILSFATLTDGEKSGLEHTINHIMISPSGRSYIFIHRFYDSGIRYDRLYLAGVETDRVTLLVDYGMVSHCCWVDENRILGYFRDSRGNDGYHMIDIQTGMITSDVFSRLSGYGDGHPSICSGKLLTDTYPNKAGKQVLIEVDCDRGELVELGLYVHPPKYFGSFRCDLHPRWNFSGDKIFFDSVFSGKRRMYSMSIGDEV
jgi:hypothetical protein